MKKTKKRFLALLLTLTMVLSMGMQTFAAGTDSESDIRTQDIQTETETGTEDNTADVPDGSAWSYEVQSVVDKIYNFYAKLYNQSFISPKELMRQSVQLYADPGYYGFFDKATHGKGAGKYVSAAFRHYCKNFDTPEQT